ncbi:AAA family ATPase [Parafrigoribacterium soli]|uniref:AAA family ATPase n=1 Tax=Parafrigoribacterium soli TaxID=3144663 RepID=UPI0032EF8FF9
MRDDLFPIREVTCPPGSELDRSRWPCTIPAVRQLLDDGLELGQATILVGENGSGKSTLVEAIAGAFGLSPEGGSTGARLSTRPSESELREHVTLVRNAGATRRGYFLRGETAHGLFTYLEQNPGQGPEPVFHELSHGESFLSLVESKFRGVGFWVLDEPEAALSFNGCLRLVRMLAEALEDGRSQVIMSTHSPVLAALPGATILEVGDWGFRPTPWTESELVMSWRSFLAAPQRHIRGGER